MVCSVYPIGWKPGSTARAERGRRSTTLHHSTHNMSRLASRHHRAYDRCTGITNTGAGGRGRPAAYTVRREAWRRCADERRRSHQRFGPHATVFATFRQKLVRSVGDAGVAAIERWLGPSVDIAAWKVGIRSPISRLPECRWRRAGSMAKRFGSLSANLRTARAARWPPRIWARFFAALETGYYN